MATRSSSRPLGDRFLQLYTDRGELWQSLRVDPPLVISLVCLAAYGLLVLFSASGENVADVQRQAFAIGVAFVVMTAVAQLEVDFFRRSAPLMFVGGLLVLGIVLAMGSEVNGAKAWLDLPGLPSFQPSELEKFLVPMMLAWYMSTRSLPDRKSVV